LTLSTYGIATLVAGGIAATLGFFKGLWVALFAAKKFIIIGIIALVVAIKKYSGGQERHRKLMPPFSVGRPAECKVKSRGWIVLIHHSTPVEPLSKGVRIKCNLLGGLHSL
jgi:hypothetical protein